MAAKRATPTLVTYFAAGNAIMTNCAKTGMPGISMHYFPKDETLRQKWIRFVRIHRKDFVLKKQSALCSAHYNESCFDVMGHDTDNNEEEARWTAHLSDVHVPPFVAASGPNIALDNPSELDVFLNFLGDDLWDRVAEENNCYAQ